MMLGRIACAAFIAVVLIGAPARAQQGAVEDVVIAVPNFTFTLTPTFVADELGLWAKHGLRFKMVQVAGVGATNAVIAGSADFAQAGGSTLTRANARGQRLIAIANTVERNIVMIALRKELAPGFDPTAPLEKRAQVLRGRTIGVGAIQANPHAYLRVVASHGGIDPESIRVTAMEGNSMLAAFQRKTIDGMSNSPPFPLGPVIDGSAIVIASGPAGDPPIALNFAYNVVLTRPETCEKRKSLCMKVGQVYKEAVAYMHEHPKQTEAILQKHFANLDAPLIDMAFKLLLASTPRVPSVTAKALENADDFNIEGGLMKSSEKLKSYDGLFTDEFVK
jgi:ABC-type nitrate/sulfonate/bicarbonate transport system substrate-binding protein